MASGTTRQVVGLGKNRLGYWNAGLAYGGICGIAPIYAGVSFTLALATLPLSRRLAMVPQDMLYWSFQEFMRLYFEVYPGLRVVLHGDRPRDEDAIYISNHQSNMDWFITVLLAGEIGGSGRIRYMLKDSLTMLPLFGWAFALHGCVYVSKSSRRNQGGARNELVARTRTLGEDGIPVWLVVFPEGTRYNPVRYPWQLVDSAEAAIARGEDPANFTQVKFPRAGGFACSVLGLRDSATAVYDVTTAYTVRRRDQPELGPHRPALCTMEAMMAGQFHEVHIHLRRTPMDDMPRSDADLQAWLVEQFRRKNRMLEQFYGGGVHGGGDTDGGRATSDVTEGGGDDALYCTGMGAGRELAPAMGTTVACAIFWNSLLGIALLTSRGRRLYLASVVVGGIGGSVLAAGRLALLRGRHR
eukprot:m.107972 g.107972  ORF g.107972 m.107972 type:complete len:413 (+) comp10639_c0_seq6:86-1324(+)